MIPIPIRYGTAYRATKRGAVLKFVSCENCFSEYVYLFEQEAIGTGESDHPLNHEDAASLAEAAAEETLITYLENDFESVPCPACGHYQRFMFPKMLEGKWPWLRTLLLALSAIGCLNLVVALYWSGSYWIQPNDSRLQNMVVAWSALLVVGAAGYGVSMIKREWSNCFDPNLVDQHTRIAEARSRAITRAEFEAQRAAAQPPEDVPPPE